VNAWIRIGGFDGVGSTYGLLVVAKVLALGALGLVGLAHRRAVLPRIADRPRQFWRVAAGEAVLMGATFGLAAALAATAPPVPADAPAGADRTPAEIVTGHPPSRQDIAAAADAAASADAVVVGTITAGDEQAALVEALLATGRPVVTVALRTPFDLAAYPGAGTHLCTYSILGPSMDALADVLFGVEPARGTLPAAIPGLYPRGHGVTR